MKRLSKKQKEWLIRRDKANRKRHSRYLKKGTCGFIKTTPLKKYIIKDINFHSNVDMFENHKETIALFNDIFLRMRINNISTSFFFNIERVTNISVESIMYIIAIITNIRYGWSCQNCFRGNFPKDIQACERLKTSGFLNFVKTNTCEIKPNCNLIQITSGNTTDEEVARNICDFVNEKCKTDLSFTRSIKLYEAIIELMSNTRQHAYTGRASVMINKWYIFVEDEGESIRVVVLDTGLGIPKTVCRKRKKDWLKVKNKDSKIILSTLKGEGRSETCQPNRNKGLPFIMKCCLENKFHNFKIMSGKGVCQFKNGAFSIYDLKEPIHGTILMWSIHKNKEEFLL